MHSSKLRNSQAATLLLLLITTLVTKKIQAQFDIEDSNTTAGLRGIHNVGGGVAWASGTNGTVLRTEDGGYLWQTCTIPPGAEKLDFRGIQAFDENTAIVMSSGKGDLSRLYKTTDGCQTWKLLFTNPDKEGFWDAIQFMDRDRGYLLGDPVNNTFQFWRTRDAGDKWEQDGLANSTFRANPLTQGAFAASNSALWVSNSLNEVAFGTGGTAGAMVYSISRFPTATGSAGGGSRREIPIGNKTQSSGVFSLCLRYEAGSAFIGVAVGGDYTKAEVATETAAQSPNGGVNWHPAETPPQGYRSSVAYDPTQKLWITVGPNGTDISRDDGKNWTPLKPSGYDPPDADKNWNALSPPLRRGPPRTHRPPTHHPQSIKINPRSITAAAAEEAKSESEPSAKNSPANSQTQIQE
jgi:photosystem II stability/assembly factor-like uncharacterized protein